MLLFQKTRYTVTRRSLHPQFGFMHIPKCGGTQLMTEIEAFLRPLQRVEGWDLSQTGGVIPDRSIRLEIGQEGGRVGGIYVSPTAMPAKGDMVAGHFARSTLLARYPDIKIMSILREPQSRVLSHWFYLRDYTDEILFLFGNWGSHLAVARQPLRVFLTTPSIACLTDNIITRMLLCPHELIPQDDFIDERADQMLLDQALARLAELDFVDIIENDAMRSRLLMWLGAVWGQTFWSKLERRLNGPPRGNPNEARPPLFGERRPMSDELGEGGAALLATRSRLDAVLWRHVASKLPDRDRFLASERAYLDRACTRYDGLLTAA